MVDMVDNSASSIIITGGTRGLGFTVAETLIAQGCGRLTIAGRNFERGEAAAQLREKGANCLFVAGDVARVEDCRRIVTGAISHHGFVNGLVNSAADTSRGNLVDTSPELFDRHMDANVKGPFFLMQGVARHLLETGKPGSTVNILSTAAFAGRSFLSAYSTSKGALTTLTKNTANAYRADLIRCNAVAPGWMDTPGEDVVQKTFHDAEDDWLEKAEATAPMGQLVKPAQMAPLIGISSHDDCPEVFVLFAGLKAVKSSNTWPLRRVSQMMASSFLAVAMIALPAPRRSRMRRWKAFRYPEWRIAMRGRCAGVARSGLSPRPVVRPRLSVSFDRPTPGTMPIRAAGLSAVSKSPTSPTPDRKTTAARGPLPAASGRRAVNGFVCGSTPIYDI